MHNKSANHAKSVLVAQNVLGAGKSDGSKCTSRAAKNWFLPAYFGKIAWVAHILGVAIVVGFHSSWCGGNSMNNGKARVNFGKPWLCLE